MAATLLLLPCRLHSCPSLPWTKGAFFHSRRMKQAYRGFSQFSAAIALQTTSFSLGERKPFSSKGDREESAACKVPKLLPPPARALAGWIVASLLQSCGGRGLMLSGQKQWVEGDKGWNGKNCKLLL